MRRLGLSLVTVLLSVLIVCADVVAIPGVWRDNPQTAAKLATYAFLGLFDLSLLTILVFGWRELA